jgi:hypothetical protein
MATLNSNTMPFCSKNFFINASVAVIGALRYTFLYGFNNLAILEFSTHFLRTSGLKKEDVLVSFCAMPLTSSLLLLLLPCLTCLPKTAKL